MTLASDAKMIACDLPGFVNITVGTYWELRDEEGEIYASGEGDLPPAVLLAAAESWDRDEHFTPESMDYYR
jgi:hypothetical protein